MLFKGVSIGAARFSAILGATTLTQRNLLPAFEIIRSFEGIEDGDPRTANLDPYLCPAGYWTIGYGHVVRDAYGRMLRGKQWKDLAFATYPNGITLEDAGALLRDDIAAIIPSLEAIIQVPLNDNQFCALVSLAFNIGVGAFWKSTMLKKLNAGDYGAVPKELMRWVRANGKTLAGLKRRREAEAQLWLTPVENNNAVV